MIPIQLPRPGKLFTTRWYKYYHGLVQVLPRPGKLFTTRWYKYYHVLV